jgi:Tfp pilus assembly protein PilO
MDKNRLWVVGVIGAIFVVALGGWFLGISPVLGQASAAQQQRSALILSNDSGQARVALLKTEFAGIAGLKAKLGLLSESVPADADMPAFLRAVNALTVANQVTLGTVTIGDGQTFVATAVKTPQASRLIQIPLAISVSGSYANVLDFIGGVQNGARLYLVNSVVLIAGNSATANSSANAAAQAVSFSATITGFVYTLPSAVNMP